MDAALQPADRAATELVRADVECGELLDPGSLPAIAGDVAGRQAARLTREAYAGVYRAFCQFVGADAGPDALTPETVRAYRDLLERHGRSPATIAKHLSALRTLAAELGVERVRDMRGHRVARGEPRALTAQQYARLLRMPDRRTTTGRRDLALLHLLAAKLRDARAPATATRVATPAATPRCRSTRAPRTRGSRHVRTACSQN